MASDNSSRRTSDSQSGAAIHSTEEFPTDWRTIWLAQLHRLQEMTAEHDRAGGNSAWYKMMAQNFNAVFQHGNPSHNGHSMHNVDPSLAAGDHDGSQG